MTSTIMLAGPDEAADLGGYLERLLRFDKAAAVRVVAADSTVGVYGRPPFEVLTLRTFGLAAGDSAASVDVTLSAGQLLDGIATDGVITLPAALTGATTWAGFLPPRAGWVRTGALPAAEIDTIAVAGIAEFKERAEAITDTERTRAMVDGLAAEIWDRRLSLGVPVRAAHTARAMAFLGQSQSADVAVSVAGRWLRLDAPYGTVVVRVGGSLLA
jgi:hypothetical protein